MSSLAPPGETARVEAASALALAPHYDDEVLGCGGLIAQLAAAGARVEVLFLSDSAALAPAGVDANDYAARRRAEAGQACETLGVTIAGHLGLPDGALPRRVAEMAAAIEERLLARPVELLLVPSPLEVTADHRAVFAAVHRLLAPLRGDGALDRAVAGMSILAYEVNRLLFPDLLVDITAEVSKLEAAMTAYASQQQRHDYLAAKLAIARFRTLSLPREVAGRAIEAAEGYRRLSPADFSTRSLAALIRHLGGIAELAEVREGPRVSLVVRTKDRPELLARALASVAAGSFRNVEVVLVNDGGRPPQPPAQFPLPIVRVELPEDLGRARAAQAGVESASGDYIGFLDDDDALMPEHLATLAGAVASAGVRVAYSDAAVAVYELSPSAAEEGTAGEGELGAWRCVERRLPYSRDFDPDVLLVDNYIPFNTLLIERSLFAEVGAFDAGFDFFEDWDFLIRLAQVTPFHHLRAVTCEYRHYRGAGHHILGEEPRSRADFLAVKARVLAKHAGLLSPARLARAVDTLRREAVERGEEIVATRRTLAAEREALQRARREAGEHEQARHRLHGEVVSLREAGEQLRAAQDANGEELRRLYAEEARLREELAAQTETVAATYGEIERLGKILRDMESTRAWRLHQWWQGRR
jgi:LmbE family N-acetylglucosaminyl deacetylase